MKTSKPKKDRIVVNNPIPDAAEVQDAMTALPFEGKCTLPVLISSNVIVFPQTLSPLMIEREASDIVRLSEDEERLVVILPELPSPSAMPGIAPKEHFMVNGRRVTRIGTVARIVKSAKFGDGTARLLVRGLVRCAVSKPSGEDPGHLYAVAEILPEMEEPTVENDAFARNILQRFYDVIDLSPNFPDEMKVALANVEGHHRLVDIITDTLNFPAPEKITVLTLQSLGERLKFLTVILNRELDILKLGSEIQSQVNESISKNNREHFLREQIEVIRKELGEGSSNDVSAYRERMTKVDLPLAALQIVRKELDRMTQMPSASAEYQVSANYVDWILALPWNVYTQDRLDIAVAGLILEEDHYGLKEVKDRILEHLAVLQLKKDGKSPILCFVGPPGVGKTSLGQSIARALDRRFVRMSLGGVRDEAEVRGHRRTYIGALPGRIITGIKKAGSSNPVFMLDELDKLGADYHGDPSAALLEVLDPAQNNAFNDHFLELDYDLSKVFFIATANLTDTIPSALLDRMEIIRLSGYTPEEKRTIAKRFLIPRQLAANGLSEKQLSLKDSAVNELINGYTMEAGVRQLERVIASVCRKQVRRILESKETKKVKTVLGQKDLKELLGARKYLPDEVLKKPEVGVATGMAWTAAGGCILPVEVSLMPGKGELKLTGSLGDVMKESALTALSFIRAHAERFNIESKRFSETDIHIHVPDGSTPKDGPSAGVTLLTALVSAFTNRPVAQTFSMTGELTLRGKVTAIGGVKEKSLSALRSGIRQIILPEQNRKDLEEIPEELQKEITFHFVKEASDVLKLVLQ